MEVIFRQQEEEYFRKLTDEQLEGFIHRLRGPYYDAKNAASMASLAAFHEVELIKRQERKRKLLEIVEIKF